MNEQVFAAIFWSDEAVTFVGIKPLNCTFTHTYTSLYKK
jgi:hypothetical protein